MKKIFILFIFSSNIYSQNLIVEYSSYIRQKLDEKTATSFGEDELGRAQVRANEEPPTEFYRLIIKNNESSFTYKERINNSQNQVFDIRFPAGGFGTTYHNLKDYIQLKDVGEVYGKMYILKDSLQNFNWKIEDEWKAILGFEVKKATTEDKFGNSVIAWFAPKIVISHGPADFWGLPGLILELVRSSNEREYKACFFAESVKEIDNPKLIIPKKGIMVTFDELDKIYKQGEERRKNIESEVIDNKD